MNVSFFSPFYFFCCLKKIKNKKENNHIIIIFIILSVVIFFCLFVCFVELIIDEWQIKKAIFFNEYQIHLELKLNVHQQTLLMWCVGTSHRY